MKSLVIDIDMVDDITDIIPKAIGYDSCSVPEAYERYLADHYVMHICLSGSDMLKIDGNEHTISAGEMFVNRPGQRPFCSNKASECYVWVAFCGKRAQLFSEPMKIKKAPSGIAHHLMDLLESKEKAPDIYASIILEVLYTFYTKTVSSHDKISEVRNYIKDNPIGFMTVNDIAAKFGFERSYLHRIFKQRYGISIKQFILDTKMIRAKALLENGNSVLEVAYIVGYSTEFNFSRAFKQYYGVAPSVLKTEKNDSK